MTPLEYTILLPLMILSGGSLILLMAGAFGAGGRAVSALCAAVLAASAAAMVGLPTPGAVGLTLAHGALFNVTPFSLLASLLLVMAGILTVPMFVDFFRGRACKPELFVLLTLSITGMVLMVSAGHMLTFYVGLELMSFPLYILAAFLRNDMKSSEAGLKYFVLGGLASAFSLFGIALLYAGTGQLGFEGLRMELMQPDLPVLVHVGVVLALVGLMFKLSVVPFHMWTPDVYEGSPTAVTALMSSLPKIAAVAILLRLLAGPLAPELALWQPGLQILAAASMVVGGVVAIVQRNLKRLLAWSTIANVGFILVGAASGTAEGAAGTLFYVTVYAVTSLGLFAGIMLAYAENVENLKGLAHRAPWLATGLAINLFSLAGVPPLAGFMGKLNVFVPAVHAGMVPLVVVGVLASVVACFYSLYLIKVMVFEEPTTAVPLLRRRGLEVVLTVSALMNVALGLLPGMLYDALRSVAPTVF